MKIVQCNKVNFLTAIFYVLLYRFIHVHLLVEYFESFGFFNQENTISEVLMTNILAILPICFFSSKLMASNFISILLYFFLYVPSIITLQYNFADYSVILPYQCVLCVVMMLFFLSIHFTFTYKYPQKYVNIQTVKGNITLASVLLLVIMVINRGRFNLVSFSEVYDLRETTADIVSSHAYIGYFTMWLTYYFIPFFLIVGLMLKRWLWVMFSCLIAFIIYTFCGAKAAITAPLFAYFIYLVLSKLSFKYFFLSMTLFFTFLSVFGAWFGESVIMLISFVFLRTLGICGYMAYAYIDFFQNNPYTHWGHITIIDKLFHNYPYQYTLGKEVAAYNHQTSVEIAMNANANFLMTDGVAAYGLWGILIIGILFWLLLILLNDLSYRHNKIFACVLLFGAVQSLLNVSLFTTLVSSGLLFVMFTYRCFTLKINRNEL